MGQSEYGISDCFNRDFGQMLVISSIKLDIAVSYLLTLLKLNLLFVCTDYGYNEVKDTWHLLVICKYSSKHFL